LSILNHSLDLSIYYFSVCCTILNDLKFFKHVANLPWRINPKKKQPTLTFFHTNVTLWSTTTLLFVGPKKWFLLRFCQFKLYLATYMVKFMNFFFTSSQSASIHGCTCPIMLFFKKNSLKFVNCTRIGNFGVFWSKHSQGTLGVKL